MKSISIRELHEKTGEWVRQAARHERIIVTDRGQPVAALTPFASLPQRNAFKNRALRPGYARLSGKLKPSSPEHDSSRYISDDRDRV